MKLYVKKPGGWTQANPNGVFMETAVKVSGNPAKGIKTTTYEVFYRVVPDVPVNIDTKHRQPSSPLAVRTGQRIRKEAWQAPGVRENGEGTVQTLKLGFFECLDCRRKLPLHLESQTLAARPEEYAVGDGMVKLGLYSPYRQPGRERFHGSKDSKVKSAFEVYPISRERIRPFRDGLSFSNVCTKCANKRMKEASAVVPVAPAKPQAQPFVAPVYAPRPKKVIEQYGMIVNGRHGGSKLKIGGHNVIRREDIELYNLAILVKRKSTTSLKPRIHKAA